MKRACLALFALVACGGPPPKNAETPDPPLAPTTHSVTPDPSGAQGAAEPATSEDVGRGTKLLERGDVPGAKAAFEAAVAKNKDDAEAHYYLGLVADQQGDKSKAEKEYGEALRVRPHLEAAAVNLGALYIDSGRLDDALRITRKALEKQNASAQLHSNLGVALAQKGGSEAESAKEFEAAEKLAPKDAMVALTHGMWLGKWKQTDAAKARLKTARDLAGDDVGILASAGFELKNIGAFADCIGALDRAIAKKDAAELRTYRALCKLGEKDKPGALSDLQAAVKSEPNYGPAHFYLGGRLAEEGKREDAIAQYEAYVKLEPKGPLAQTAGERIKILKEKKKK